MATITYWDLKENKLLNKGDFLLIYGINYQVTGTYWFLSNFDRGNNSAVFKLFGMTDTQKMSWAKQFAKRGEVYNGGFPEFSDYQDFIDFVIAIYEKPLIKVGDTIRVKERDGDEDDYPYAWVKDMLKYQGKCVQITQVLSAMSTQCTDKRYFNGDIHYYMVENDGGSYKWHSSMFMLETLNKFLTEELLTVKIDSSMGCLVADKGTASSYVFDLCLHPEVEEEKAQPTKEVSSEGIILNKPKKHFQTKIVL